MLLSKRQEKKGVLSEKSCTHPLHHFIADDVVQKDNYSLKTKKKTLFSPITR